MRDSGSSQSRAARLSDRLAEFIANPPPLMSAEEARAAEEAERRRAFLARLDRSGVPARFRAADLGTCCPEAAAWLRGALAGDRRNLVLAGESGEGKTHTACALVRAWMWETGRQARFATMRTILAESRAALGTRGDPLAKYRRCPLLAVDELGKEQATEWSLPLIEDLVDARYAAALPTVFTTQYDREALAARWARVDGDAERAKAIVRRITEGAVLAGARRKGM